MPAVPENEFFGKLPSAMVDFAPELGLVLGSGLASILDLMEVVETVSYQEIDGLPGTGVPGHAGRFVLARLGATRLVIAEGRAHLYEGYAPVAVTAGIRCLHASGIKRLVLTNAAGTVNSEFQPGRWMMLSDQLNLTGSSPLLGGAHFFDMSEIYSEAWRATFRNRAKSLGIELYEGIYVGVLGPQYETPAEVRMFCRLGGDAVGMSTVLEAIQARVLGIEVSGFSCLTNWGAGLGEGSLDHGEVMKAGVEAAGDLVDLLGEVLPGA